MATQKLELKIYLLRAVDKIQVLRNYAEVGQLSGVRNNQDNYAINIKLKQEKKVFGLVMLLGCGHQKNLYLVQPKLFYYNQNTALI